MVAVMEVKADLCPQCGERCDRIDVDIGVGIQYGPASCPVCGWSETDDCADFIEYVEEGAPF